MQSEGLTGGPPGHTPDYHCFKRNLDDKMCVFFIVILEFVRPGER